MTLDNRPVLTFGPACATRRALASHIRPGCLSGPKAQDGLTRNAIGADQLVLEVVP